MVIRSTGPRALPPVQTNQVDNGKLQRVLDGIVAPLQLVIEFLRPYVQREPWRPVTFQPLWENVSADAQGCEFRKDPLGRVWVRGEVTDVGGAGTTIFVLPINYRPSKTLRFAVAEDAGTAPGAVEVSSLGNVVYRSGDATQLSLNFSFDVES